MTALWLIKGGIADTVFIIVSDDFLVAQMHAFFRPGSDLGEKWVNVSDNETGKIIYITMTRL